MEIKIIKKRYLLIFWKEYYEIRLNGARYSQEFDKEYWDSLTEGEKEAELCFLKTLTEWHDK